MSYVVVSSPLSPLSGPFPPLTRFGVVPGSLAGPVIPFVFTADFFSGRQATSDVLDGFLPPIAFPSLPFLASFPPHFFTVKASDAIAPLFGASLPSFAGSFIVLILTCAGCTLTHFHCTFGESHCPHPPLRGCRVPIVLSVAHPR